MIKVLSNESRVGYVVIRGGKVMCVRVHRRRRGSCLESRTRPPGPPPAQPTITVEWYGPRGGGKLVRRGQWGHVSTPVKRGVRTMGRRRFALQDSSFKNRKP